MGKALIVYFSKSGNTAKMAEFIKEGILTVPGIDVVFIGPSDLSASMNRLIGDRRRDIEKLSAHLDALSPLNVLGRGYSLTCSADGTVIKSVGDAAAGDEIVTHLPDGDLSSTISEVRPGSPFPRSADETRK